MNFLILPNKLGFIQRITSGEYSTISLIKFTKWSVNYPIKDFKIMVLLWYIQILYIEHNDIIMINKNTCIMIFLFEY